MSVYISCADAQDALRAIDAESVDLVVTSPPYDNLRTYEGIGNTWTFDKFKAIASELLRVVKKGGTIVWIVADATINGSETGTSFKQALFFKEIGFNLHDTMIWVKPTFTATGALKTRYAQVFEYMFVFTKGRAKTFNPLKDRPSKHAGVTIHGLVTNPNGTRRKISGAGRKQIAEFGQRFNVWKNNTVNGKERCGHPAPFPEQLAIDHILSWSNPGDLVLDPFMGSGTTAVASIKTHRNFFGFEIVNTLILQKEGLTQWWRRRKMTITLNLATFEIPPVVKALRSAGGAICDDIARIIEHQKSIQEKASNAEETKRRHDERAKDHSARVYARRKEEHRCVACGDPLPIGETRVCCDRCRAKQKARADANLLKRLRRLP